jgi:hypothetical protein
MDAFIPSGKGQSEAANTDVEVVQLSKMKTAAILVMEFLGLKVGWREDDADIKRCYFSLSAPGWLLFFASGSGS